MSNFPEPKEVETIAKQILENLKVGMTLKDATGLSDEALEEVYCLAHTYYGQGKYYEARCLFQLLAGASPSNYKFVFGLAASTHQMKSYEEAVYAFYIALTLEPENVTASYYLLDSLLKLENFEEAEEVTTYILEQYKEINVDDAMKQRVLLIRDKLKNRDK